MEEVTKQVTVKKLSTAALVGLILGIIALLLSAIPIINNFAAFLAVIGLVFGIVGLVGTTKSKRRGKGMAIAAIILSVLAFIIVIASQSFYSSVLDGASKEANKSLDKMSGDATADILGKDVDVTLGTFSAVEGEYGIVTTKLPVKVTNKLGEAKSYYIKVEAVDAAGNRIVDDTISVDKLGSTQSQDLEAFKYVESTKLEALKTATFKISSVSEL
ncbi:MAG: DUF4190 domain-containing protein [Candidatus Saccharimonadales bacterium]